MSKAIYATFDGEVLRPEETSGLEVNERYLVIVEKDNGAAKAYSDEHPLTALLEMATDMGASDLASRHDFYAHGKNDEGDEN